jgi:Carboxypeptidase regulatory-like domain
VVGGWGKGFFSKSAGTSVRLSFAAVACAALILCLLAAPRATAQAQTSPAITSTEAPATGNVSGTIVDRDGAVIAKATVTLMQEGAVPPKTTTSDDNGHFVFTDVAAGNFQLKITAAGFANAQQSGVIQAGQHYVFPQIALAVATAGVDVEVIETQQEVAQDQVKIEEKQRVFGFIPNYYVTYEPHPAPLPARLKFQLAWKTLLDPVSLGLNAFVAGGEQAVNMYGGYGQGAQGYAKRYGAAYGDFVSGTLIGGALLPILFKQDPRYYWKGTGTVKSRLRYAVANSVVRKGDNGHWQPDYSSILGSLASSGISNLYYPPEDRNGPGLTFENTAIGIAGSAAANIFQEFVVPKLTPHRPGRGSNKN